MVVMVLGSSASYANALLPNPLTDEALTQELQKLYYEQLDPSTKIIATTELQLADIHGFTAGYCTSYVAYKRPELFIDPHSGARKLTGNARDWLLNAKRWGALTGKEARQGAVAVFTSQGVSEWGHVALVEYVRTDGLLVISDMNYKHKHVVTTRLIHPDQIEWYIY